MQSLKPSPHTVLRARRTLEKSKGMGGVPIWPIRQVRGRPVRMPVGASGVTNPPPSNALSDVSSG